MNPCDCISVSLLERALTNLAVWHTVSIEALGSRTVRWPGAWAAVGPIPPIYLNAIVLPVGPQPAEMVEHIEAFFAPTPRSSALAILDGTNRIDLSPLGFERSAPTACFWREASDRYAPPTPPGLEIVEVHDPELLADFEKVSLAGFGQPPLPRFSWHAPGVLVDPCFRLWLGSVGGCPVGAAMAYVGSDVVGVYGVTVAPTARRRGFGAALAWRATRVEPRLPAVLKPSPMSIGLYHRMGYAPIGLFNAWRRPAIR